MGSSVQWMRMAIAMAEQARFHAPPNPWVGCVIVKAGRLVGQGYTQPPGQAHAEIMALQQAGAKAQGASLYVTLEPCVHTGKTPPCTAAIINAGIRQVYAGIQDPDIQVQGQGLAALERAGLKVIKGICAPEIQESLIPYLYHRRTALPYTILKAAVSIDGRIAAADRTSQWITTSEARQDAHLQRAYAQAIVIGADTALHDNPRLTIRHLAHVELKSPLRVLLDSTGRVPAKGALFDTRLAPTLVITSSRCPLQRQHEWIAAGAEVALAPLSREGVDLLAVWQMLGQRGILQVLVEGGSTLYTALLETPLVNRLMIYIGPILMGASGYPLYHKQLNTLQAARSFKLQRVEQLGECVRLEYTHSSSKYEFLAASKPRG